MCKQDGVVAVPEVRHKDLLVSPWIYLSPHAMLAASGLAFRLEVLRQTSQAVVVLLECVCPSLDSFSSALLSLLVVCPGGRMVLSPKEPADVHQLMADDAQPNIRVWQVRQTSPYHIG